MSARPAKPCMSSHADEIARGSRHDGCKLRALPVYLEVNARKTYVLCSCAYPRSKKAHVNIRPAVDSEWRAC